MNLKVGRVGVDEAGRGPLAGPVAIGAFFVRRGTRLSYLGLADSKKLSKEKRDEWFEKIRAWKLEGKADFAVSLVSPKVIDKRGITFAIRLGIRRCLKKLSVSSHGTQIFLDGGLRAPDEFRKQKTIIRGDEKVPVISLASIVAKVTRDRYMKRLSKKYPEYGFEIHKGYGTKVHIKNINKHGSSDVHRETFINNF